jgi:hypothetical protein
VTNPTLRWVLRSWWTPFLVTAMTFAIAYKFVPLNLPGPVRACLCERIIKSEANQNNGLWRPASGWCQIGQRWLHSERGDSIFLGESYSPWREDILGCNRPAEVRQYAELIVQVFGFYLMLWLAARWLVNKKVRET